MTQNGTQQSVIALVQETLQLPDAESIDPCQLLFRDLRFTSMDFLDLVFRVEDRFHITIPEGTITRLVRGDLTEAQFSSDGYLTDEGKQRLFATLHDTPIDVFPDRIHASTLPQYCTVGAVARLVDHLRSNGHV